MEEVGTERTGTTPWALPSTTVETPPPYNKATHLFMYTVPTASCAEMVFARASSLVKMAAVRPYSLSLMRATAWASLSTGATATTGPKDSLVMMDMVLSQSATRVGWKKRPWPEPSVQGSPPVSTRAPLARASFTWLRSGDACMCAQGREGGQGTRGMRLMADAKPRVHG